MTCASQQFVRSNAAEFRWPPRQFAVVLKFAICRTSICIFVGMPPGPGAAEIRPAME